MKTTLGIVQNILFRSNRNEMQEEFKTLKYSLFYNSLLFCNTSPLIHKFILLILLWELDDFVMRIIITFCGEKWRIITNKLDIWSFDLSLLPILIYLFRTCGVVRTNRDETTWLANRCATLLLLRRSPSAVSTSIFQSVRILQSSAPQPLPTTSSRTSAVHRMQ